MSSITSRSMVDKIIKANGRYSTDPVVVEILQYENMFDGGITYKLIYAKDNRRYIMDSLFGQNVRSIWKRGDNGKHPAAD